MSIFLSEKNVRADRAPRERDVSASSTTVSFVVDAELRVQMVSPDFEETVRASLPPSPDAETPGSAAAWALSLRVDLDGTPSTVATLVGDALRAEASCASRSVPLLVGGGTVAVERVDEAQAWLDGPSPHVSVRLTVPEPFSTNDTRVDVAAMLLDEYAFHENIFIHRFLPDTTELVVNEAYADLFNAAPEEVVGTRWMERARLEDRNRLKGILHELTPEEPTSISENKLLGADGCRRWIRWHNQGLFNEAGELQSVQSIGIDLTGHKLVEESLRENQSRFYQIARTIDEAFWLRTRNQMLYVNPAFETIWGIRRDDVYDDPFVFLNVVHPDDRERVERVTKAAYDNGEELRNEYRVVRDDGEVRWVRVFIRPIHADGDDPRFAGIGRDVTEQKEAEQKLRESREQFQMLAENVTDVVMQSDATGQVTWISPSVTAVFGRTVEEAKAVDTWSLIHPDDREAAAQFHLALTRGDDPEPFLHRALHKDGHYIWIEALARPIYDDAGELTYVQTSAREVTERVKQNQQLRRAMEEAEEADRLKSAMLANMSHEIRTPLTSIMGFAELLVDETDGEGQNFARLIHRSSKRLLRTLDSVLQLSKLEAGARSIHESEISLREMAEEVVEEYRLQARQSGITLRLDVPAELRQGVWDEDAVRRVLMNLVDNALKFTASGGTVEVRISDDGDRARVEVADDGIGMSASFQEQMFQAFKQESEGIRRSHEGSGLGLAIVERLVELQQGEIRVQSAPGEGTTMTVLMPWEV